MEGIGNTDRREFQHPRFSNQGSCFKMPKRYHRRIVPNGKPVSFLQARQTWFQTGFLQVSAYPYFRTQTSRIQKTQGEHGTDGSEFLISREIEALELQIIILTRLFRKLQRQPRRFLFEAGQEFASDGIWKTDSDLLP